MQPGQSRRVSSFRAHRALITIALFGWSVPARSDSVVPIIESVRPSAATVALIHPVTGTSTGGASASVRYAVGDVLTHHIEVTLPMNGASRDMGGYVTVYVPPNTEVVGARFVDATGAAIAPDRGGIAALGWGPRGAEGYMAPLAEGAIAGLYGETGIYFSTDPRTARNPSSQPITVQNGVLMNPPPTGASQVGGMLGISSGQYYVHNEWDWLQVAAYGIAGGALGNGTGNTPFQYGSAVAGSGALYGFEATETSPGVIQAAGVTGPWQRIACPAGCETGTGVAATAAGAAGRAGVPTSAGWMLGPGNPLPASANAVRFALGGLRTGDREYLEIALRVLASPLDPGTGSDLLCVEAFAGDASSRREDGAEGGRDNPWRYCVPSTGCEPLAVRMELDVDRVLAVTGDQITYTLRARNLTLATQTNVALSQDLSTTGALTLVSASGSPAIAGDVLTWPALTMAPGDEVSYTVVATVSAGGATTSSRAVYISDQVPAPGLIASRLTTLGAVAVPVLGWAPVPLSNPPGTTVSVTGSVQNVGTGALSGSSCVGQSCVAIFRPPSGFSYVTGSAKINGAPVADPANVGGELRFAAGLPSLNPSQSATIAFDLAVAPSVAPGEHPMSFQTWLRDPGIGRNLEDSMTDSFLVENVASVAGTKEPRARLDAAAPSPFSLRTRVAFHLPFATGVRLTVHDVRGWRARTLIQGLLEPGSHVVVWDGRDHDGRELGSGLYLIRLEAAGRVATEKVLKIR